MSQPGYLAVGGVEVANNARTAAYLDLGLGGPQFQVDSSDICPSLTSLAYPLEVCDTLAEATADQLYTSPLASWRVPSTGLSPPNSATWDASGWITPGANVGGITKGMLLPDIGAVDARVLLQLDTLTLSTAVSRLLSVARVVNVGTANVGWIGIYLLSNGTNWSLGRDRQVPGGASTLTSITGLGAIPTLGNSSNVFLEVIFSATGVTGTLYGSDPGEDVNAPVIGTGTYGYDSSPFSTWALATGQTEADQLAAATEIGLVNSSTGIQFFGPTELVVSAVSVSEVCDEATGTSYPSGGAWPGQYPGAYGYFSDPGNDNAPWFDADRPASSDYLGLLVTGISGLDTTETRSMSANATGIGGILGPQTLAPRSLTVTGYVLATTPTGMQFARRWLAETLAGALCPGCSGAYVDVVLTCGGDDDDADLWRIYDAGLTALTFDLSDPVSCDYVVPVEFTIGAADPYLYKLPVLETSGFLNSDGADDPAVPFETWLYGEETPLCVDVEAPAVGITAPLFVFDGGTSGIESGLVYLDQGHYPSASLFPGECVYPATGDTQWDITTCPFAFSVSIGPDEVFVVDNARRRLDWYLSDGSVLNGAPRLNLQSGEVIQWIDTCDGDDITACAVAYSGCTCDDTASVTIYTQHRER